MCLFTGVCVYMWVCRPEVDIGCLPQLLFTLYIETKIYHVNSKFTNLTNSLARKPLSPPPKCWDYRWAAIATPPLALCEHKGPKL